MFRKVTAAIGVLFGGSMFATGTTATAQTANGPVTADPVGVAVPSSVDLLDIGIFGSTQLFNPGGFGYGLQVLADLVPLALYSAFAQVLALFPIDHIAQFS
ncbi:MAG: hypothetical protein Q4A92_03445 [Corynebacterium sp.]|nr:hypothetical protein [Corynebacterium sp.]